MEEASFLPHASVANTRRASTDTLPHTDRTKKYAHCVAMQIGGDQQEMS